MRDKKGTDKKGIDQRAITCVVLGGLLVSVTTVTALISQDRTWRATAVQTAHTYTSGVPRVNTMVTMVETKRGVYQTVRY